MTTSDQARSVARRSKRRIPFIQQLSDAECGIACLAMTLSLHGRDVPIEALREATDLGRDGTTARMLLDAARRHGLTARAARVDLDALPHLPKGTILHWDLSHFVVFERLVRNQVQVLDPAVGRRRLALDSVRQSFSGVVLLFEPAADFIQRRSTESRLRKALSGLLNERSLLARLLIVSLLMQGIGLVIPALIASVVDKVVPHRDLHLLVVLGAAAGLAIAFQGGAALIRSHFLLALKTRFDASLSFSVVEHLLELPLPFFMQRSAGDLFARLAGLNFVREVLTSAVLSSVLDGGLVIVYGAALVAIGGKLGALPIGLGLIQILLLATVSRRRRELTTEGLIAQSKVQASQLELLTGMETLKSMAAERRAADRWSDHFVDALNIGLLRGRLEAGLEAVLFTIRFAAPFCIVALGARLVVSEEMTLGTLLGMSALAGAFFAPLTALVATGSQLQSVTSYLQRIDDLMDAKAEVRGDREGVIVPSGAVALEGVSFRYGGGSPFILRDVSLTIPAGSFVAVVGRSGSGKSTLGRVLLGLVPVTEGTVRFDGADLAAIDPRCIRRHCGVVTQDPVLFTGTIRDNIAFAVPDAPLQAIVDAATRARVHDEIAAMPLGYDTPLGDRGSTLSGGQRQRIAIARALLSQPTLLLLDEATSSLDASTEAAVQHELAALRCTRIAIAHRLSTIVGADQIIVLQDGCVVERGTHPALLALRGAYAALVEGQVALPARGA